MALLVHVKDSVTGACSLTELPCSPTPGHAPLTVTSPEGTIDFSLGGVGGQTLTLDVDIMELIAGICANPAAKSALSTCLAPVVIQTNISASKTVTPASPVAGSPMTFNIVVNNSGAVAVPNVTITDNLLAGFTVSAINWSYTGGATGGSGSAPNFTIANMPAGSTATLAITGSVATAGTISNSATVGVPAGYNNNSSSSTATTGSITVTPAIISADLSITRAGPAPASGDTSTVFTYSVTASNGGSAAANGAAITAGWPAGFTIASETWSTTGGATNGTGSGGSYTAGNLPNGSTATVTVTGTYATAGTYAFGVTSVAPPAGVTDPNMAGNTIAAGGGSIAVSAPTPAELKGEVVVITGETDFSSPGTPLNSPIAVEYIISNTGGMPLTNIDSTMLIPTGINITSAVWSTTGGASVPTLSGTTVAVASLPAGATAKYSVQGSFAVAGKKEFAIFASVPASYQTGTPHVWTPSGDGRGIYIGTPAVAATNGDGYAIFSSTSTPAVGTPFDVTVRIRAGHWTIPGSVAAIPFLVHIPPGITVNSVTPDAFITGAGESWTATGPWDQTGTVTERSMVFNCTATVPGERKFGLMVNTPPEFKGDPFSNDDTNELVIVAV